MLDGVPGGGDPLPLVVSSDQSGANGDRRAGATPVAADHRGVCRNRRRSRFDAELVPQGRRALVVGAHGARPIAGRVMGLDAQPMGRLVEWIGAHEPAGHLDGLAGLPVIDQGSGEPPQEIAVQLAQLVAAGGRPRVVLARQQLTAVEVERGAASRDQLAGLVRVGAAGCVGRGDEAIDVDRGRADRLPLQRRRRHLDRGVDRRVSAPQRMEQVAEVGTRLALVRVGPELECQPLSRLCRVGVEDQQRQQRPRPSRPGEVDRLTVDAHLDAAQQPDVDRTVPHAPMLPRRHPGAHPLLA